MYAQNGKATKAILGRSCSCCLGVGTGRLRPRNLQSTIRPPDWRIGENQFAFVRQSGGCGLSGFAVWRMDANRFGSLKFYKFSI